MTEWKVRRHWDNTTTVWVHQDEAEAKIEEVRAFARKTVCGQCGYMSCKGCTMSADDGRR